MVRNRVIPCLLIKNGQLVKTVNFSNARYVGDPVNAIKIFNEKEVDELIVLDISPERAHRGPDLKLIREIADECFMPVCYGGGINTVSQIQEILKTGIEKVSINTALHRNTTLINDAARRFGSQCIVASLDIRKTWLGSYRMTFESGTHKYPGDVIQYLRLLESSGAGEVLINDITREGTWSGFDIDLLTKIGAAAEVPVIATGGAGNFGHIADALAVEGITAVAIGSMAVYQNKGMGVLINFPSRSQLETVNYSVTTPI